MNNTYKERRDLQKIKNYYILFYDNNDHDDDMRWKTWDCDLEYNSEVTIFILDTIVINNHWWVEGEFIYIIFECEKTSSGIWCLKNIERVSHYKCIRCENKI